MNGNNLVIVCGKLTSGGAERVISILSKPFAETFSEVKILTWREGEVFYKIDSRVEIISLPKISKTNNTFKKILFFRKWVQQSNISLILSFLTIFNILVIISTLSTKIPIIVAERNDPRFLKGGIIMRIIRNFIYRFANGIICQTQTAASALPNYLQKKIIVIFNPITMKQDEVGSALISTKSDTIISVGRILPQKDHKLLIDAFNILLQTFPSYRLKIYGKIDTTWGFEIQQYIKDKGLIEKVILEGEQKDILNLIKEAKIFILTSKHEGMPNALIEAMCLGLPVISTKVAGAIDLIQNGYNGFLVEPSKEQIANTCSQILANTSLAHYLGQNASKLFDQLNVSVISRQWISYLLTFTESSISKN